MSFLSCSARKRRCPPSLTACDNTGPGRSFGERVRVASRRHGPEARVTLKIQLNTDLVHFERRHEPHGAAPLRRWRMAAVVSRPSRLSGATARVNHRLYA